MGRYPPSPLSSTSPPTRSAPAPNVAVVEPDDDAGSNHHPTPGPDARIRASTIAHHETLSRWDDDGGSTPSPPRPVFRSVPGTSPAEPDPSHDVLPPRNETTSQASRAAEPETHPTPTRRETAVIYCESHFGGIDGKTANGLVRHSDRYDIVSIIDSTKAGQDAGSVLGEAPNQLPIALNLDDALAQMKTLPDCFVFGLAPSSGELSHRDRTSVLEAIDRGLNVVSGLHEFLNDDHEFVAASKRNNVRLVDIRRPRAKKDLQTFSGQITTAACVRIAILGTDCAIGKRTTATILTRALNEHGLKTILIGTGQTGLMQGARYGVALDAVPSQFCSGELESAIVKAYDAEKPDVIIVEGQGALSHPAYSTSAFILRGSRPHGVVLQHAPARMLRCDFETMEMPTPMTEINLIETFCETKVIGLSINHENMSDADVSSAIDRYECELGLPASDALWRSPDRLVEMVVSAFPALGEPLRPQAP